MYQIRLSYCLEQRKGKVKDDTKVLSQTLNGRIIEPLANTGTGERISLELSRALLCSAAPKTIVK